MAVSEFRCVCAVNFNQPGKPTTPEGWERWRNLPQCPLLGTPQCATTIFVSSRT